MQTSEVAKSTPMGERRVEVLPDLYRLLSTKEMSLIDVTWIQHQFHEKRRWSAVEMIDGIDFGALTETDKVFIWNAGRAELTTKPGADRLVRQADAECRRWQGKDDVLAAIMQSCSTWARYWNEEEAYHENVFNILAQRLSMPSISDETFIEFRKIFPDDGMLRTVFLLTISEINATSNYVSCAALTRDAGLRKLFKQVAADEVQHMRYYISFGKALVDSGKYPAKDAFAMAHMFLREGGEIYGSGRGKIENRSTHVNWWDHLETGEIEQPDNLDRKQKLIFSALEEVTGIRVSSADEVEEAWMDLVAA